MTTEPKQTHTTTGTKTAIDIPPNAAISFVTIGDVGDYTADVEVLLTGSGTFVAAETAITDKDIRTTTGPIQQIRINISDLGTATTLDFEVLGISR